MSWKKLCTRDYMIKIYTNGVIAHCFAGTICTFGGVGLAIVNPKARIGENDPYLEGLFYGCCIGLFGILWPISYPTTMIGYVIQKTNDNKKTRGNSRDAPV